MQVQWGVAPGAPVQGLIGIAVARVNSGGSVMSTDVRFFGGVDWASETHQVCLVAADGKIIGERAFAHGGAGLADEPAWARRVVDEGVRSCPRAGCGRSARPVKAGIEPLIAMGRQPHHPPLAELFQAAPEAPQDPTPVEAMAHRLKTPVGRALYALRKQMPEPVFGIIKSALGFRQFSLRGLAGARGEWSLVAMAWNIKRIFACVPA